MHLCPLRNSTTKGYRSYFYLLTVFLKSYISLLGIPLYTARESTSICLFVYTQMTRSIGSARSWHTSMLCIMVELAGGGTAINGATQLFLGVRHLSSYVIKVVAPMLTLLMKSRIAYLYQVLLGPKGELLFSLVEQVNLIHVH